MKFNHFAFVAAALLLTGACYAQDTIPQRDTLPAKDTIILPKDTTTLPPDSAFSELSQGSPAMAAGFFRDTIKDPKDTTSHPKDTTSKDSSLFLTLTKTGVLSEPLKMANLITSVSQGSLYQPSSLLRSVLFSTGPSFYRHRQLPEG